LSIPVSIPENLELITHLAYLKMWGLTGLPANAIITYIKYIKYIATKVNGNEMVNLLGEGT